MLLEPVLENNTSYIELVKEIDINLLKSKFNFQNVTVIPANKHSLQEDGSSCGAYVCYYLERIWKVLPMLLFLQAKSLLMNVFDFTQAI